MHTVRLWILFVALGAVAAGGAGAEPPAETAAPAPTSRMDMLQLMRAFPFPHANVLFDTQVRDPEGEDRRESMSFSVYRWGDSDVYAGWAGVENSALALAEMAPLLLLPRACANGNPAPVDREDWQTAVEGLIAAGEAGYAAARSRNQDEMIEFSETLTNACAACHGRYRDVDLEGGERCMAPSE
jgi:hypothetical protein